MKGLSPHALGLLRALDVLVSVRQVDQAAEELIGLGLAVRAGSDGLSITASGRERAASERKTLADKAGRATSRPRKPALSRSH